MKTRRPSRKAYHAAQKEHNGALRRFREHPEIAEIYAGFSETANLVYAKYDKRRSEHTKALDAVNALIRFLSIIRKDDQDELKINLDDNSRAYSRAMDTDEVREIRNELLSPYEDEMLRLRDELLEAGWTEKEL